MEMFPLGITEKFKKMQIDKGKGNWAKIIHRSAKIQCTLKLLPMWKYWIWIC